ncbi:MAG: glycosyltransferase family protein [Planctomycetota bacterium]
MATIFYSMAGEGRGHATRVKTVTGMLRERHRLILLAPGDAYDLLEPAYRQSDVEVLPLPCLRFAYDAQQRVSWPRTTASGLRYVAGLRNLKRELGALMRREGADLLLTDFDPGAPRAAQAIGLPYVAIDHQSFLWAGDVSWLPGRLGLHARAMGVAIKAFYRHQCHTISSSFFKPEPRSDVGDVTFVGSMLRPQLLAASIERGEHVVAYCRRKMPDNVLETLAGAPCEVRVYGLGEQPDRGSLRFRPISEDGFVADLASARAVVATAGNQLLGEVLYLGKPVLALPEVGQTEQLINCHFLDRMGGGEWILPHKLGSTELAGFLERADGLASNIDRDFARGNERAVETIERALDGSL